MNEEKKETLYEGSVGEVVEAKKSPKVLIIAVISIFVVAIAGILIYLGVQNGKNKAEIKTLGDFMSYSYKPFVKQEVTDHDVDVQYDKIIDAYKQMGQKGYKKIENPSSDTIKDGDVVYIDYSGFKDGVKFDGGTGSTYLKIGSGTFIPGFETGLIGVKLGETVDLNLTFPENYDSKELAGQDVVFTVKVHYFCEEGELTKDNIYVILGFPSVDDCTAHIRKTLERQLPSEHDYIEEQKVRYLENIIENSEFGNIDGEANELYKCQLSVMEEQLKANNMTLESLAINYGYESEQALKDRVLSDAKDMVKSLITLEQMAVLENLSMSDEEFDKFSKQIIADATGVDVSLVTGDKFEEYKNQYEKSYGKDMFDRYIRTIYYLDACFEKYAVASESADAPETEAPSTEEKLYD